MRLDGKRDGEPRSLSIEGLVHTTRPLGPRDFQLILIEPEA